ncbi:hypothetical protein [Candidatus Nitrosotalea bavarica]|uniref:hypothetical protein n=1 Tax=Candidatus Nitrosotalea bavarica TaxID=1903277 RepID=UPI000C70043E|nr:hypothetical protein [Candidatus Nitrosotalea bavarica]
MREERVILSKIDVDRLVISTKNHLQELGLKIIHEDTFEGYHSIKAYKGGIPSLVTGSVRDVEILITGKDKDYELTLRTGAWGRDIAIPSLLVSGFSFGVGAVVAGVEVLRVVMFEKNFWAWLNKEIFNLGEESVMTTPQVVAPQDGK